MHVSYNLDKCAMDRTKQNYTVSQQNSEPKKIATCQHTSQSFLETTTLKTMLTSAVKRRELIDFTIFSESAYTCNLLLYSIIWNKRNY